MEKTFHMLLYRVSHAMRGYLRPHIGELGLGSGQPKLVAYLAAHGPCRQKELADYFEIDPAAVSRMLDIMRKAGFVTCRTDEHNRRSDVVELTEKGRKANERWQEYCREMENVMLQGFAAEEREVFAQYLSRAYRNFKGRQSGEGAAEHE